jgi:hypothetical protein
MGESQGEVAFTGALDGGDRLLGERVLRSREAVIALGIGGDDRGGGERVLLGGELPRTRATVAIEASISKLRWRVNSACSITQLTESAAVRQALYSPAAAGLASDDNKRGRRVRLRNMTGVLVSGARDARGALKDPSIWRYFA